MSRSKVVDEKQSLQPLIFKYVMDCNLEGVKKILDMDAIDINKIYRSVYRNRHDTTLLWEACHNYDIYNSESYKISISILKELLKHGANPNLIIRFVVDRRGTIVDDCLNDLMLEFIFSRGVVGGRWEERCRYELCVLANFIIYNGRPLRKQRDVNERSYNLYRIRSEDMYKDLSALPRYKLESISNYDIDEMNEFFERWRDQLGPGSRRAMAETHREFEAQMAMLDQRMLDEWNPSPERKRELDELNPSRERQRKSTASSSSSTWAQRVRNVDPNNNPGLGRRGRMRQIPKNEATRGNREQRKSQNSNVETVLNEQGGGKKRTRRVRRNRRGSRKIYR
jgi:hypothetical protein